MSSPNLEQKKAIEHGQGPLLIVAGAGTGKTTVLKERFKYLVNSGKAKPEEILCLVFNEDAAAHLEDKIIEENTDWAYCDLWIQTFHAFCDKILRRHCFDIGLADDFKILSDNQGWILMRKNLDKFDFKHYQSLGNPAKFLDQLSYHFKECKEEGIYPEHYLEYADSLRVDLTDNGAKAGDDLDVLREEMEKAAEVARAYAMYQKTLLDNNSLDFGDQLNYCLKLFKKSPATLKIYRDKFKYILVDEFQDTNRIQYELVKILAAPKNNLSVVGDDDQSIYRFRGAVLENVLDFCHDFPEAKIVVLKTNYRSTQSILDWAYKSIVNNNPNRLEHYVAHKKEVADNFLKQQIRLEELKKLCADSKQVGAFEVWQCQDVEEEAKRVVQKIKELQKCFIPNKSPQDLEYPDFAILARTNAQAQKICSVLQREGIDFRFLASKGFYQKPIILEALSYLKLLDNYHESAAVYKVLRAPVFDVPEDDISKITEHCRKKTLSLYEGLKLAGSVPQISGQALAACNKITSLVERHREMLKEHTLSETFTVYLEEAGYFSWILQDEKTNPRQAKENVDLLNQFLEQLKEFEESQVQCRLSDFLEQVNFEIESGEKGTIRSDLAQASFEQVQVMTVHKAKGLEFNHVFVIDLVQSHFPTYNRGGGLEIPQSLLYARRQKEGDALEAVQLQGDDKIFHEQEERRLFYVALTRARLGLYLSHAQVEPGLKRTRVPSKFLSEIGLAQVCKAKKVECADISALKPNHKNPEKNSLSYKLPETLSYTQLAAFEKCPYQYKLEHIMRVPKRGRASTTFGRSIHSTVEEFVDLCARKSEQKDLFGSTKDRGQFPDIEELYKLYDKHWQDEWFESKKQKEDYYQKGREILKNFYENLKTNPPKLYQIDGRGALESSFTIKIGDKAVYGKIDRIDDRGQGKIAIIDYKTGTPKDKLDDQTKAQLLIYQIAAKQVHKAEPVELIYYYLEDGSTLSFLGSDEDIENLIQEFEDFSQALEQSNFSATPGRHCDWCDYRDICEFRD